MPKTYSLNVTAAELEQLYAAVIYSRDTAFVNTGDKHSPAVRVWENLRDKITALAGRVD